MRSNKSLLNTRIDDLTVGETVKINVAIATIGFVVVASIGTVIEWRESARIKRSVRNFVEKNNNPE